MRRVFKSYVLVEREKEDDYCFSQNNWVPFLLRFFKLKIAGQYLLKLGHDVLD